MAAAATFSKHGVTIAAVCIVLLLFVVICNAMAVRDKRVEEGFIASADLEPIKGFKSNVYNEVAMKYFYSDGNLQDNLIFFTPSNNDIVCKLGSDQMTVVCSPNKRQIDNISCADSTTLVRPLFDCSRSVTAPSKTPVDLLDCRVRVLDGMYNFVKSCITVTTTTDGAVPTSYGARFIVLARPCFISGPLCKVGAVGYGNTGTPNSMIAFDSDSVAPLKLMLDEYVKDPAIADGSGITLNDVYNMMAKARKEGNNKTFEIPMTLYYLNYNMPVLHAAGRNVLTLYIPSDALRTTGRQMFSMESPQFAVSYEPGATAKDGMCVVKTATGTYKMAAPPSGHVVLCYTTSLLIMAYMSSKRVIMKQIPGQPIMNATDGHKALAASLHPPPREIFPYTNTCIPNLADVAIKFGYL